MDELTARIYPESIWVIVISLWELSRRILFVQLLATTVVSGVFKGVSSVQTWVQANPWMMWVSLFGTIGTLIGLFVVRRKYPANFYLLGAFT
jgi:protein lifeguard